MKTEYIYISIALVTLVINIVLVAALLKMNSEKKQKSIKASTKNSYEKSKVKVKQSVDNTEGVDNENLSFAEADNKGHNDVGNESYTVLLQQNQYTEVLNKDIEEPK